VKEKRAQGAVYVCTDIDFSGTCAVLNMYNGQSYSLRGSVFDNSISSIGADEGQDCYAYE
jgi:hypothetical protein